MASTTAVTTTTGPEHIVITIPPEVYQYADRRRGAEQGIELQAMEGENQAGLRSRTRGRQNQRDVSQSESSTGTLTPSSSTTSSIDKDWIPKSLWLRVRSTFDFAISSKNKEEEIQTPDYDRGYDSFIKHDYEDEIFQRGFPQLAAYMSSDEDFGIFRGFKYCHTLLLLEMMVEITEMGKTLSAQDKSDAANLSWRLTTTYEEGEDPTRRDLLKKLEVRLKEYDDLFLKYRSMQQHGPAPARNHFSLFNFIWSKKPLSPGYWDFVLHSEDFISSAGQRKSYFQNLIEEHLSNQPNSVVNRFVKTGEKQTTFPGKVIYRSDTALKVLERALTVAVAFSILLVPVFLLYLVPMSPGSKVITVAASILFFAIVMSIVGSATDSEIFIGTATYAAVLIIFLGNISTQNGSISSSG